MTVDLIEDPGKVKQEIETAVEKHTAELRHADIVMVDDEPLMLEVLETYLEEEGYTNFTPVQDSTQAIDLITRETPDVVFLDINMPVVDGFQILEALRAQASTAHLAVIVLTSASEPATKLRALELGATDFLEKPIDSSELALRLHNTLTVKAYQDQLAYYDGLTGLPNRSLFVDRLGWSIANGDRSGAGLSVMDVSLDRFRKINDSLGPLAGDEILRQTAERLQNVIRDVDVVGRSARDSSSKGLARMGGDEFSILLPGISDKTGLARVADRLLACMAEPFLIDTREVYTSVSIGIARYPEDGSDTQSLVKNAGAAKEYAKQQGRDNYQFFSGEITFRADRRMSMEADLRRALEREELQVYYQPQVVSGTGIVVGMEALIRWIHPQRGNVSPELFIPLAEENTALINSIGAWVLVEACRQTHAWHQMGLEGLDVSVNVSARQFEQAELVGDIRHALTRSGLDPQHLMIELTEGVMMNNVEETGRILREIKQLGVKLSVDDFGTGYSALAYLKRFPIDELKIDRSFVTGLPGNTEDGSIIKAVVAMSHSLDLKVVAEGVENEEQAQFLNSVACDLIQGYYYAAPLPAREFYELVQQNRSAA